MKPIQIYSPAFTRDDRKLLTAALRQAQTKLADTVKDIDGLEVPRMTSARQTKEERLSISINKERLIAIGLNSEEVRDIASDLYTSVYFLEKAMEDIGVPLGDERLSAALDSLIGLRDGIDTRPNKAVQFQRLNALIKEHGEDVFAAVHLVGQIASLKIITGIDLYELDNAFDINSYEAALIKLNSELTKKMTHIDLEAIAVRKGLQNDTPHYPRISPAEQHNYVESLRSAVDFMNNAFLGIINLQDNSDNWESARSHARMTNDYKQRFERDFTNLGFDEGLRDVVDNLFYITYNAEDIVRLLDVDPNGSDLTSILPDIETAKNLNQPERNIAFAELKDKHGVALVAAASHIEFRNRLLKTVLNNQNRIKTDPTIRAKARKMLFYAAATMSNTKSDNQSIQKSLTPKAVKAFQNLLAERLRFIYKAQQNLQEPNVNTVDADVPQVFDVTADMVFPKMDEGSLQGLPSTGIFVQNKNSNAPHSDQSLMESIAGQNDGSASRLITDPTSLSLLSRHGVGSLSLDDINSQHVTESGDTFVLLAPYSNEIHATHRDMVVSLLRQSLNQGSKTGPEYETSIFDLADHITAFLSKAEKKNLIIAFDSNDDLTADDYAEHTKIARIVKKLSQDNIRLDYRYNQSSNEIKQIKADNPKSDIVWVSNASDFDQMSVSQTVALAQNLRTHGAVVVEGRVSQSALVFGMIEVQLANREEASKLAETSPLIRHMYDLTGGEIFDAPFLRDANAVLPDEGEDETLGILRIRERPVNLAPKHNYERAVLSTLQTRTMA